MAEQTKQKTLRELLTNLLEFCLKECGGEGDCFNCGQKPLNIDQAIQEIRELVPEKKPEWRKKRTAVWVKDLNSWSAYEKDYFARDFNQAIDQILERLK